MVVETNALRFLLHRFPLSLPSLVSQIKAWTPADARLHWSWKSVDEGYIVKVCRLYLFASMLVFDVHITPDTAASGQVVISYLFAPSSYTVCYSTSRATERVLVVRVVYSCRSRRPSSSFGRFQCNYLVGKVEVRRV